MKAISITSVIFVILLLGSGLNSQTYHVSVIQEPYVSLGSGFPLVGGTWDDPEYTIPIGFPFVFFDDTITMLTSPASFLGGSIIGGDSDGSPSIFHVYGPDIIDQGFDVGASSSLIFYSVSGSPGQRVFEQEWNMAGLALGSQVNDTFVEFINFQMKLYESNGDIVFHFGPSSILSPEAIYEGETGPSIGLFKNFNGSDVEELVLLTGNPLNPTVSTSFPTVYLNGSIPENTMYRFSNMFTALERDKEIAENFYFFPNPTSGQLSIREDVLDEIMYPIQFYNSNGQLIRNEYEALLVNLEDFPPGVYASKIQTRQGIHIERILVLPGLSR